MPTDHQQINWEAVRKDMELPTIAATRMRYTRLKKRLDSTNPDGKDNGDDNDNDNAAKTPAKTKIPAKAKTPAKTKIAAKIFDDHADAYAAECGMK